MDDGSQTTAIRENALVTLPRQTLSCARNQTVVVERRRRRILLASKPSSPGAMSYSMVTIEDVEVVRTTTVHSRDDAVESTPVVQPRPEECDTDLKKAAEVSPKAPAMNGRARFINSSRRQKLYHYLPNGPARRSRYNVPPKEHKTPATPFIPPTTHVIHPSERDGEGQKNLDSNYPRQPSPSPSSFTSSCDTAPSVQLPPPTEQGSPAQFSNPYASSPYPYPSLLRVDLEPSGSSHSYTPPYTYTPNSKETYSIPSPSQHNGPADLEETPMPSFPSHFDFEQYSSGSGSGGGYPETHSFPSLEPETDLESPSPTSETMDPREGLGSREYELRELRDFWKEFYGES
ncbi:hypothetical protein E1B28_009412 [Marasmius oreades]|uniref:Uncharacterized protein n=1 Tax=Marasmius oreades TaxID=181124 RepID=A0A9P7S102_9AGAR|nr:uncharacterized protein E1B28_009412 [Marasmius oreades]KAG7093127.1 hypothetical protein E1B28_009412 [Marasmius oreades]